MRIKKINRKADKQAKKETKKVMKRIRTRFLNQRNQTKYDKKHGAFDNEISEEMMAKLYEINNKHSNHP